MPTTNLCIPDINVWVALVHADHPYRQVAYEWWISQDWGKAAFVRQTQLGFLRLLTTDVVMNGKPLSLNAAWGLYDRFFEDERIVFLDEPHSLEQSFRRLTEESTISPKLWADRWLMAFAETSGATLVTCDKALAKQSKHTHLLLSSN
jgi:toxin-antitoxin system PIN domain toxin